MLPEPTRPRRIQLPRSSTRLAGATVYVILVEKIGRGAWGVQMEGPVKRPGAVVEAGELGTNPVALECAGPVGHAWQGKGRRRRESEFILWRYNWQAETWQELARATALLRADAVAVLAEVAQAYLHPRPELFDLAERALAIAGRAVEAIDGIVGAETEPVRARALDSIHHAISGKLAALD